MEINEKKAKELFKEIYPSGTSKDFAGRIMKYDCYNKDCEGGWNVDHKLPESLGGTDNKGNLQCTNIITNQIKADNITWKDQGNTYQVRKVKGKSKTYEIVEIKEKQLSKNIENVIMDETLEKTIFLKKFPNGIGYDYTGREIHLNDYNCKDSKFGWTIREILPSTNNHKNRQNNLEIYHFESLYNKRNKTCWVDGNKYYQAMRKNGISYIIEIKYKDGKTYIK